MATLEQLQDGLVKADAAGATEDAQVFADSIRAHPTFQQNAKESLDSGDYKYAEDGYTELDKDAQRANMSKSLARSMGLKDSEVDVTQGMDTFGRVRLSFKQTQEEKFDHLEKRYGRENIKAIDVGGDMKLLYRDENETGGQFRAVDEEGLSVADFFGDTAGSVAPIAGAVGGAVAGTLLAPGLGTIAGATAGAALGGFTAGAAQDTAERAISGTDLQLGETGIRRGIETAIGVPIDLITGGTSKLWARGLSKRVADKTTKQVLKAIDDVNAKYSPQAGTIRPTTAMEIGGGAAEAETKRAGFGGTPSKQLENIRVRSAEIRDLIRGKQSPKTVEDAFQKYVDDVNVELKTLRESGDRAKVELADVIENKIANNAGRLRPKTAALQSQRGNDIQGAIQDAVARTEGGKLVSGIEKTRVDLYDAAQASAANVRVGLPSIQGVVKKAMTSMNLPTDMAGDLIELLGNKVGKEAAKMIDDLVRMHGKASEVNIKQLDDWIQQVGGDAKLGKLHARSTTERDAKVLYDALKDMRDKALKDQAPDAAPMFAKADTHFMNEVLPAREKGIAKILKTEGSGQYSTQGEQVTDAALSNSASVREILSVTNNDSSVRQTLRDAYLDKVTANPNLSWDDDIVKELWSRGKIETLKRAQSILKGKTAALSAKTEKEFLKAMTALDTNSANKALAALRKSNEADESLQRKLRNKLVRAVREDSNVVTSRNAREFVETMAGAKPAEIEEFMGLIAKGEGGEEAVLAFRQSAFDHLSSVTRGSTPQTAGKYSNELWTPELMSKQLKVGSKSRERWVSLIGEESVKDLDNLNKIIISASEPRALDGELGARLGGSVGRGGFTPYALVSGSIPSWAWRKVLNVAYGSKMLKPLTKIIDTEGVVFNDKAFQKILPSMMASRRGVAALGDEMDADPEFEAFIGDQIGEQPQESN